MILWSARHTIARVLRAQYGVVPLAEILDTQLFDFDEASGGLFEQPLGVGAHLVGEGGGTVTGAPKVRTMQVIAELEPETRGAYAGGVGYFSPDGSLDSCIVLRTGVVKDGTLHVQAGAGIVADSNPEYEQRECEAKASALIAAAREAVRVAGEADYGQ